MDWNAAMTIATWVLVIITFWQARKTIQEMKLARRADPELLVYPQQPRFEIGDYKQSEVNQFHIYYLSFTAILVNPGLVPIVVTESKEIVKDEANKPIVVKGSFNIPPERPERVYISQLPWVIASDNFAIWSRRFSPSDHPFTENEKRRKYQIELEFKYFVGKKQKTAKTNINYNFYRAIAG